MWWKFRRRRKAAEDGAPGFDAPRLTFHIAIFAAGSSPKDAEDVQLVSRVVQDIRESLKACLAEEPHAGAPPCVRVLSALFNPLELAVCEAALDAGAEIQLVLPMSEEATAAAFPESHRARFQALLTKASAVMILDDRTGTRVARAAAARIVVDNAQAVLFEEGAPCPAAREWLNELRAMATDAGVPAFGLSAAGAPEQRAALVRCVRETVHMQEAPGKAGWPPPPAAAYAQIAEEWHTDWAACGLSGTALEQTNDAPLRAHYAQSDYWACLSARYYRRLGLMRQVCISMAVFFVALGFYVHSIGTVGMFFQFGFLATATLIFMFNRVGRWHSSLTDYRLLAELLRISRIVRLTGRRLHPRRLEWLEIERYPEWITARFVAIQREAGLASVVMTHATRRAYATFVTKTLDDQIAYQERIARRHAAWHRRYHTAGMVFLVLSFLAILGRAAGAKFVGPAGINSAAAWYIGVKFLAIVFPGASALFFGCAAFGAHDVLARRAELMARHLRRARQGLQGDQLEITTFLHRVFETAVLMASEVLDWRGIVAGKPIGMPL